MGEAETVTLFPLWREAAKTAASDYSYGDVIEKEWLIEHFGLRMPARGTAQEFQKFQFDLMDAMEGFREVMLLDYKMAIENIRGRGYRILQPNEQTGYSVRQFRSAVAREVRKHTKVLQNVAPNMLTTDEQRENIDARSKLAAIYSFTRTQTETPKISAPEVQEGDSQ